MRTVTARYATMRRTGLSRDLGRLGRLGVIVMGIALLSMACGSMRLPWQPATGEITASGTLEADEVVIAPRVSGTILALPVSEGAAVHSGDLLARLDDAPVQLQIRQTQDAAARQTYQLQAEDYTLISPVGGIVTRLAAHVGETAFPGQVLLAVSDLSSLKLTLYVREAELAHVRVGQELRVTADPYPSRVFRGVVTSIHQQAEFTPRNVQTQSDRLNLVFGVEATVENADGALKPGMPVDADFEAAVAPR
jgi:multidrug resistance efflux pump